MALQPLICVMCMGTVVVPVKYRTFLHHKYKVPLIVLIYWSRMYDILRHSVATEKHTSMVGVWTELMLPNGDFLASFYVSVLIS